MNLSLPLAAGQELLLEPLAGQVVMQLVQHGLRPTTAILSPADCATLIDTLGLMAVCAEEQSFELDVLTAYAAAGLMPAATDLARVEPPPHDDIEIPAFLRRVPS